MNNLIIQSANLVNNTKVLLQLQMAATVSAINELPSQVESLTFFSAIGKNVTTFCSAAEARDLLHLHLAQLQAKYNALQSFNS